MSHALARFSTLRKVVGALALALSIAAPIAVAPSAEAAAPTGTVMATTQRMSAPTLNSTQVGTYAAGKVLTLSCYAYGQPVSGYYSFAFATGYDSLWYKVSDGYWVPDVMLNTNSNAPLGVPCTSTAPTTTTTTYTATSTNVSTATTNFVAATQYTSVAAWDGANRGECVALVSKFLANVHGIKVTSGADAWKYQAGGIAGQTIRNSGMTWHTDRNFRNGDILVWGASLGGYGHVAIWNNGKIYDQNYAGRRTAAHDPYFSSSLVGYWRK